MNKWTAATQIVFCLLLLVVVAGTSRFPSVRLPSFLHPGPPRPPAAVRPPGVRPRPAAPFGVGPRVRPPAAGVRPRFVGPQPFQARPHAPAIPRLPAHSRPVERIPSVPVAVHIHLAPVLLVPHYQVNPAQEKSTEAAKPTSEKSSTETAKPTSEKSSTEAAKPTSEKSSTETAKPTSEKSSTETAKPTSKKSSTEAAKGAEDGGPTDRT